MRGCLFILVLGAIALAIFVVVGLPAVAAGVVTAGVGAAGLQADDTTVTVSSNPPTDLVGLHADTIRIQATDATFRGLDVGALDITLTDVALVDRTAGGVEGTLTDVSATDPSGSPVQAASIDITGDSSGVTVSTLIDNAVAETLISDGVEREIGIRPTSVRISAPDRLTVKLGVTVTGRFEVNRAGDLLVRIDDGLLAGTPVTLLEGGGALPVRLTGVRVTSAGDLLLDGDLALSPFG